MRPALTLFVLGLVAGTSGSARQSATDAQAAGTRIAGFRYEAGRISTGRVYRYKKSNPDGSEPSEVALYLASETRLEALKWRTGTPEARLVIAEMDWDVASVASFTSFRIDESGARNPVAEIRTTSDKKRLEARVGASEFGCALERFPWHSYDFDFASLNLALRFLTDPAGEVEFEVVDPLYRAGGIELVPRGPVKLAYRAREEHAGLDCRRYALEGPGLANRGGSLWASTGDEVFLVAFELERSDEPGVGSGRLEWQRNATLSAAEWEAFVRTRADGPR